MKQLFIILTAAGMLCPVIGFGQERNVELMGALYHHYWDNVLNVVVSGNYAYIATGRTGLRVVNISDPANPYETGFYDTPGHACGVAVSGNFAYVTDGYEGGLRIIDISNPANPYETGYYEMPGFVNGVVVSGDFAFIAHGDGLRVIDISNPANPYETGFCDTPGSINGVTVTGGFAYVLDSVVGLRVIDISDPANPSETGIYETTSLSAYAISESFAYLTESWADSCTIQVHAALRIINISNPANPYETGYYEMPGFVNGVTVTGGFAYVLDSVVGLRVIDISDPANPYETGYYNTRWSAKNVDVSSSFAYVADEERGLRVIDVSDPANPYETGCYNTYMSLELDDGSTLIGKIEEIRQDMVLFSTDYGILEIPISSIEKDPLIPAKSTKDGKYWFPNPNATRMFFTPTARMLSMGEGYFSGYRFIYPAITYGLIDNITIGSGTALIPWADLGFHMFPISNHIFYLTMKVGRRVTDKFALAAWASLIEIPIGYEDEGPNTCNIFSVGTFGSTDHSFTLGMGYGIEFGELPDPMFIFGGETRVSRQVALVTENWLLPDIDDSLLSYGFRFFGPIFSFDLAMINTIGEEAFFLGIPYFNIVVNF